MTQQILQNSDFGFMDIHEIPCHGDAHVMVLRGSPPHVVGLSIRRATGGSTDDVPPAPGIGIHRVFPGGKDVYMIYDIYIYDILYIYIL